jgi:hypothetical protein
MKTLQRASLFVLTVLSACAYSAGPADDLSNELSSRHEQWESLRIHDYGFDYRVVPGFVQPSPAFDAVHIEVRADRIVSVVKLESGAPVTSGSWPTVDSLFVAAEQAIAGGEHGDGTSSARIAYDAHYGFPTSITSGVPDVGGAEASGLQVRTP